jgi:arabinofuranosyltransferase
VVVLNEPGYFRRVWVRLERFRKFGPLALLVSVGVLLLVHTRRYYPFLSDDALISLRYARRFSEGLGLTWTDNERVEGYTNLLWVLLTSACGFVGLDLVASARILDTVGVLGAILCVSCVPRPFTLSTTRILSGGLFFALAAPLAAWAVGGLEHGFLAGVLAAAFIALARALPDASVSARDCLLAGAFLGAAALLRADGIVLVLGAASGFALAGRLRLRVLAATGIALSIPLGLLGLVLLFRYGYYGTLVPNTALAKVSFNTERLLGGLYYLRDGYRPLLPAVALTLVLFVTGFRGMRAERWLPPLTVLVGWSLYLALVGGDIFPGWRQLVPAVVALGMVLAEAADATSVRFRFGEGIVAAVAVPVLAVGLLVQNGDRENLRAKNELWTHDGRPVGLLLRRAFAEKKPLLAVDAAGALPYWSNLPSLDMLGLNDRYIATHPPPTFGHGGIGHELGDGAYVLKRQPDIVAFNGSVGSHAPIFLSGRQMVASHEFQQNYQLVRARGPGGRTFAELFIRREGGKIGVTRRADRIDVPAFFFGTGSAFAELDARGRLVANNPGPHAAELPRFHLPAGRWELLLGANTAPSEVAFRCDGVSAARTGATQLSLELDSVTAVDVVVGALARGVLSIRSASLVRSSAPAGFRCAAPGARLVVPLAQLSKRKAEHSEWAAVSNVVFRLVGLRVELPELSRARAVDLSVDGNDKYNVLFARGSQVEGFASIEKSKKGGGLAVHEVTVPESARKLGFDRIEIVPVQGDNYFSVGHLLLVPD